MKKLGRCVHFNGLGSKVCEAGVVYANVSDTSTIPNSIPCLPGSERCATTCAKLLLPTAEEVQADEAALCKRVNDMAKARAAIVAALGGPWKRGMASVAGQITCPACEAGLLAFERIGFNGHILAACSNEDCVRWRE